MTDEGYLQNKIRELQEELINIKTKLDINETNLKRLESNFNKVDFQKIYSIKTQLEDTEKFKTDIIKEVVEKLNILNKEITSLQFQKTAEVLKNKLNIEVYPFIKEKMQESTIKTMTLVTNSLNSIISNLNEKHNLNIHLLEHTKTVFSQEEVDKLLKKANKKHFQLNSVNDK